MKYLSTFTGIGGFELGINKAYEQLQNNEYAPICSESEQEERTSRGEWTTDKREVLLHDRDRTAPLCIGYSEINKYATQIYEKHFPQHKNYGDITTIIASELPDFDLFVGGFPCQAFSIAGKRGGFDDTRGTLFFDCARILKEKRPRNFILENVKGLLSHDNGRTFKTIISTLVELGYCVEWQVLNAKNFGVPQNRERVFIVGHLGGIPKRKVFPITGSSGKNLEVYTRGASQGYRVYDVNGISTTLASQAGGVGAKTGLYMSHINRSKKEYDVKLTEKSGTLTATMYKGIDASGRTGAVQMGKIRRLTPLECERLMGYPDGWTEGLSDTQRYKTLGNGIVSNVVAEVVRRLYINND